MQSVLVKQAALTFACIALVLVATAQPASSHASDASTLTLDLLVDRKGLQVIDAAAQAATYDQRPSESERMIVATEVLDALGVPGDGVDINAANSDRYHEVGFTVRLRQPFSNGSARGAVHVRSERLQQIAAAASERLKLEVCPVDVSDPRLTPRIDADHPGRDPQNYEREDCTVWSLGRSDPPVTLTARVTGEWPSQSQAPSRPPGPRERRSTTRRWFAVMGASSVVALVAVGTALMIKRRRRATQSHS
jgi:hypothetical protein